MAYKTLVIFWCVTGFVSCVEDRNGRNSRLISFDTDKKDLQVSLDFNVPFLSIPFKQTIDSGVHGLPGLAIPKININPSALMFGGFIIVATSVLLPFFSKGFGAFYTDPYYRVLDNESAETNIIMGLTNQLMSVSHGCPLRIACWISQRSNNRESANALKKVLRNELVTSIFNTTTVEEAIASGRRGRDCSTYEPCPISEHQLPLIMRNFGILTNRHFV